MSIDWKAFFRSVTQPKEYVKSVCPICHRLLTDVPLTNHKMCPNGHRFGPDMKRVELINDGDFRGDL